MMHQRHLDHHSQAQRPHYLVTQGRWNEPSPPTLRSGIALSSIGLALLAAGIVIACGTTSGYSVLPLFLLSSPFLLYGGVLLLLASAEVIAWLAVPASATLSARWSATASPGWQSLSNAPSARDSANTG